jgi:hypothetical protein
MDAERLGMVLVTGTIALPQEPTSKRHSARRARWQRQWWRADGLEMSLSFCSFTNLAWLGLSVLISWPPWRLGNVEATWWLQKHLLAAERGGSLWLSLQGACCMLLLTTWDLTCKLRSWAYFRACSICQVLFSAQFSSAIQHYLNYGLTANLCRVAGSPRKRTSRYGIFTGARTRSSCLTMRWHRSPNGSCSGREA